MILLVGGICALLGIAATLALAHRWGASAGEFRWSALLSAAGVICLPLALGKNAVFAAIALTDPGFLTPGEFAAACVAWLVLAYLVTAFAYLPYFRWAARSFERRQSRS